MNPLFPMENRYPLKNLSKYIGDHVFRYPFKLRLFNKLSEGAAIHILNEHIYDAVVVVSLVVPDDVI